MLVQRLPRSVSTYTRAQRREIAALLGLVRRQWMRMGTDFDASYSLIEAPLLTAVSMGQYRLASAAPSYVEDVLRETGQRVRAPEFRVDPHEMMGLAGDGRRVDSLLYGAVTSAKASVAAGATPRQAIHTAGLWMTSVVGTLMSDTARMYEQSEMRARSVGLYVRVLNPPSCGRCTILAGQEYRTDRAFERHPGCDCRNMPVSSSLAESFVATPREYLDSLDDAQLARVLGSKPNAQAYRDGADLNQLVNAYRKKGAVSRAQVFGRTVNYTTEGVTRRGVAFTAMQKAKYIAAQGTQRVGRYSRLNAPRLMPSTIYEIAENRADALRLLKLYGWIF